MPRAATTLLLLSLFTAAAAEASAPFQRCFEISAAAHQVPLDLLQAVARTESAMDPSARSHANAHGIMQIQWPGTARHLGIRRVSELYNPCLNIDAGARYLQELTSRYRGDIGRALAAYNYGPGRIGQSGPVPDGASRYVGKVLVHRQRLRSQQGRQDPSLWAGAELPLGLFTSLTRARRMAAFLTNQLGGMDIAVTNTGNGHAVALQVPASGLSSLAASRLSALGYDH